VSIVRIGRLIPWTIALALVVDGSSRLIPIDMFSFRAWEALVVGRGSTGPFEPDRTYVNPLTYGDLARPQRYRQLRQHHLEYFSTDSWGFRNTDPAFADRPVRWLLIGDSFGVSSGVSDGSTLASQIAQISGERVYNASAAYALPFQDIRFTAGRIGMTDGVVLYEFMERQDMPNVDASVRMMSDGPPPAGRSFPEHYRAWRKDVAVDRMSILAGWAWDILATKIGSAATTDSNLPLASELPTSVFALANGATMLFYTADVNVSRDSARRVSPEYLVWLNRTLKNLNLQLAVLLVPDKYSVYGPLVKDPAAPQPSALPFRQLEDDLRSRGVFTVNATDALRKAAADRLTRNEYVYFLDDTHWNDRGIALVARAVFEAWQRR
jgi:hypothetical protein